MRGSTTTLQEWAAEGWDGSDPIVRGMAHRRLSCTTALELLGAGAEQAPAGTVWMGRVLSRLSVALVVFAVVVVLAPAVAHGDVAQVSRTVVLVRSAATAGTYTVSWRTLGGCDPGPGTSGDSGTTTMTVEAATLRDSTPTPGELTGTAEVGVVVTNPDCHYTWRVSLVEATTKANCIVGPTPFAPDGNNEIVITLADPKTSCARKSRIIVRVIPAVETDRLTILPNTFSAIAKPARNVSKLCSTTQADSEVDGNRTPGDKTDDTVGIELEVKATTAAGRVCRYDVTLEVPRGLVVVQGQDPIEDVAANATVDVRVGAVFKPVYLVQNVAGDSGGAYARYKLSRTCVESGPPPELLPQHGGGGVDSATLVELREGRFNITAAIAEDPYDYAADLRQGVQVRVLGSDGETCEATVSVSHLPAGCVTAETALSTDFSTTTDKMIFEFLIFCGFE